MGLNLRDDGADKRPHDDKGRFVSKECPDPNCGGILRYEGDGFWRCDGLTHHTDDGPLVPCDHVHYDGSAADVTQ